MQKAVTIDYPNVAEVNFSLLNYVDYLIENLKEVRFVVMKRIKADTVKSWMANKAIYNFWSNPEHESFVNGDYLREVHLSLSFPKYDLDKESAIAHYWDDYYDKAAELKDKYPDEIIEFDMYKLFSSVEAQNLMLDFIKVKQEHRFTAEIKKKAEMKRPDAQIFALKDLYDDNKLDLSETKLDISFDADLLIRFLLLMCCLNKKFLKVFDAIEEFREELGDFFVDYSFVEKQDLLNKDLHSLLAHLNTSRELYNYSADLALKVKNLAISKYL